MQTTIGAFVASIRKNDNTREPCSMRPCAEEQSIRWRYTVGTLTLTRASRPLP
jgi:hypothetical protein